LLCDHYPLHYVALKRRLFKTSLFDAIRKTHLKT